MSVAYQRWGITGLFVLATCFAAERAHAQAEPDQVPPLEGPAVASESDAKALEEPELIHEAFQEPGTPQARIYVPKAPPAPIAERPSGEQPGPRARWVSGYWAWDPDQRSFVWMAGAWRVPPRGTIWVDGRWARDANGWYRIPGFWSRRREAAIEREARVPRVGRADWRTNGPPVDHPADDPGPAPARDSFFVAGHYVPDGDRVAWTPGFWARARAGWDWVPARWIRRPSGWNFREGYWTRDPGEAPNGRDLDLPPAIVDSEPKAAAPRRDLLDEQEEATAPPPVVIVPGDRAPLGFVNGMPVRVIRPPGSYPYGPAGVVVPDVVPPFVQRLLDRVLP